MAIRLSTLIIYSLFVVTSGQFVELVNVPCDEEVRASSKCGAGGAFNGEGALSGTFVCRKAWSFLGFISSQKESVCTPTILNEVIGLGEDQCGCCNNECPEACTCVCHATEDKVLIAKKNTLFGDSTECVSRGKASRRVGDGTNNYSCVSDSQCPALAPADPVEPYTTPEAEEETGTKETEEAEEKTDGTETIEEAEETPVEEGGQAQRADPGE